MYMYIVGCQEIVKNKEPGIHLVVRLFLPTFYRLWGGKKSSHQATKKKAKESRHSHSEHSTQTGNKDNKSDIKQ